MAPARTMITALTAEQQARFPEFVKRWIAIGLSTEPADRERAEQAIRGLYTLAKLREPRVIWLPDQVVIACRDCGAAIVDQTTTPREPRKLCIGCFGARQAGGRA